MVYNPLQVELPQFEGPLDLLLHLVRKRELDIDTLYLSELTEPYLEWIKGMKVSELDLNGEFLVIAATLIWIKSRSLLPRVMTSDDEGDEVDVAEMEALLMNRLQVYKKIQDVAQQLKFHQRLDREVFARIPAMDDKEEEQRQGQEQGQGEQGQEIEVSLYSLLEAFSRVQERLGNDEPLQIEPDDFNLEDVLDGIWKTLKQEKRVLFGRLFRTSTSRFEIVTIFILLLELARLGALHFVQEDPGKELLCQLLVPENQPHEGFFNQLLTSPSLSSAISS